MHIWFIEINVLKTYKAQKININFNVIGLGITRRSSYMKYEKKAIPKDLSDISFTIQPELRMKSLEKMRKSTKAIKEKFSKGLNLAGVETP
jgi:hypothetical protein